MARKRTSRKPNGKGNFAMKFAMDFLKPSNINGYAVFSVGFKSLPLRQ